MQRVEVEGAIPRQIGTALASAYVLLTLTSICQCQAQSALATPATTSCIADPQLPAFEVAAVTAVAEKDRGATNIGQYGLPRFTLKGVSMAFLLSFSFDVLPINFIHAPRGLEDKVFDLQVQSQGGTPLTYEALKPRMQQLLQQRFCLRAQRGTKQTAGYALIIAPGGSRLIPSNTPADSGTAYITPHEVGGASVNMMSLAAMLTSPAGKPVEDQTGITGKYVVHIHFAAVTDADADPTLPSIFTAVREQVGLELKAAKVPIQTLTIDHISLIPTEN